MGKPNIGEAKIPVSSKETKKIEKLTILKDDSEESIYHLIFAGSESGSLEKP